jgi:hypothetical protein
MAAIQDAKYVFILIELLSELEQRSVYLLII